jgi:signal peptidase II
MLPMKLFRFLLIFSMVAINIGCDQISKNIVRTNVSTYDSFHFLNNHVTVLKVENTGAFLSLGDSMGMPFRTILLIILPILTLLIGFIYVLVKKNLSKYTLLGACFVIGGGFGNIIDRTTRGSVTDFLHLHWGIFQTGIFNMADVSIMIGIFILLFTTYFENKVTKIAA